MQSLSIQKINTTHPLFKEVFALREEVLRKPMGLSLYNEDTSADIPDDTFVALSDGKVIGCVLCKVAKEKVIKLRQMAVADHWQGKGVGKMLIENAENNARENGFEKIELHARQNAIAFYEKLGYKQYGAPFYEVTIPHIAMAKLL